MKANRYALYVALGVLTVLWGYSWIPSKIAMGYSTPFMFAALRTVPGAIVLLGIVLLLKRPFKPKALGLTVLLGVLQMTGFVGLTTAALVTGAAGRTLLLANTWQFWVLLLTWPLLGEKLRGRSWLSLALGFAGILLIIEPWTLSGLTSSLLTLGGAICFAASAVVIRLMNRRVQVDRLSLTAWLTLFGSIPLVVIAFVTEHQMPNWSSTLLLCILYGLVASTVLGSILWIWVLKEMPANLASLGTLGTPIAGLLFSWAQLGERPTTLEVLGMIAIVVGLAVLFSRSVTGAVSWSGRLSGRKLRVSPIPVEVVSVREPGDDAEDG